MEPTPTTILVILRKILFLSIRVESFFEPPLPSYLVVFIHDFCHDGR